MSYFDDHFEEIAAEQYEADQAAEAEAEAQYEAYRAAEAEAEAQDSQS